MGNFYPHPPRPPPLLRLKAHPLLTLALGLTALLTVTILPVRFQAIDERLPIAAGQGTTPLTELAASLLNSEHLRLGLRSPPQPQGSRTLLRPSPLLPRFTTSLICHIIVLPPSSFLPSNTNRR